MKTLNRTLLVLIWAMGVALVIVSISRTGWALSQNPLGMAEAYDNPIQPLVKIAAAVTVMVAATKLIQNGYRLVIEKVLGHTPERSVRASVG